ncbi:MAG: N-acetyl sugar amidotransferase [Bacteroidetes bacterium]|nr:N-acetyl sugar amidotransferase [Bacteroidota bacterium]
MTETKNSKEYQICKQCIMDTSDPDIVFDANGSCNHCTNSIIRLNKEIFIDPIIKKHNLDKLINNIKQDGVNNKYDCLIGLSGGVDSSYLAYVAVKQFGLRPLAVHLDNGWNSELAVENIKNIVNSLNIDLYTHVLNWEEFKALQKAFLRASVIDIEMLTDHAIGVALYEVSKKYNIKYFLSGYNYQSESVMPAKWLYPYKMDSLNIKDIYKKEGDGGLKLKTFKLLNFYQYLTFGKNSMALIPILNYLDYNKKEALKIIETQLNWRNYGNKHDESIFTKFYQDVILPQKFKIDKRRAHYSSLICSGQMTRDEGLEEMQKELLSQQDYKNNLSYFLKKLNISEGEFQTIMDTKPRLHWDYRSFAKRKFKIGKLYRAIFK